MQQPRTGRVPQQARSREKVERILDQAEAIIEREGLVGLTMRKVAVAAGVGQATLYAYFPTQDTLIEALLGRIVDLAQARLAKVPARGSGVTLEIITSDFVDVLIEVYDAANILHQVFEARDIVSAPYETDIVVATGFQEQFCSALLSSTPEMDMDRAKIICEGFYRIADAILWRPPEIKGTDFSWRQLLKQTLAGFLKEAVEQTLP